jgi:hypothetical protein
MKNVAGSVMSSFDFFPSLKDLGRRLDRDGLAADWARIGCDLHNAVAHWEVISDENERTVA